MDCSKWGQEMLNAAETGEVKKFIKAYQCPDADDINYADKYGVNSLWIAALHGHLQVVRFLLSQGKTDVNQAPPSSESDRLLGGSTPLIVASAWGHVEVVKELLSHPQTKVNQARTDTGETPLILASGNGRVEVVRMLLADRRVDPNIPETDTNNTPLMIAAYYEKIEVVKLLLKCPKVDIIIRNKNGDNALENAKKNGRFNAAIEQAFLSRQRLLWQGKTC